MTVHGSNSAAYVGYLFTVSLNIHIADLEISEAAYSMSLWRAADSALVFLHTDVGRRIALYFMLFHVHLKHKKDQLCFLILLIVSILDVYSLNCKITVVFDCCCFI